MTKAELVDRVATAAGLTKRDSAAAVDALCDAVAEALGRGERVQLVGFGTFEVRRRAARRGRNPQTGADIEIRERLAPAFKAGKALKDALRR